MLFRTLFNLRLENTLIGGANLYSQTPSHSSNTSASDHLQDDDQFKYLSILHTKRSEYDFQYKNEMLKNGNLLIDCSKCVWSTSKRNELNEIEFGNS